MTNVIEPELASGPDTEASTVTHHSRRRAVSAVRTTLLNVAAIGGAVCIVLVILAMVFNISLIMFRTGSMSPTIPTGSAAFVMKIPASEAHVGDVVTVERSGQLPVTHRVVKKKDAPGGKTELVLKGDANATVDPAPYVVDSARRVLFAIPGMAYVIVWFSNPLVMGGITIGVTALVAWVLWPRTERTASRGRRAQRSR